MVLWGWLYYVLWIVRWQGNLERQEYEDYPRTLNLLSHAPGTKPVVATIAIGRIDERRVEVQEVGVVRTRARPTRPNAPVRPLKAQATRVNVTCPHKPQRAREEYRVATTRIFVRGKELSEAIISCSRVRCW